MAFSWRTGRLVTNGIIHNPHYYAWLRMTRGEVPRNPGDVPCGGLVGAYDLEAVLRRLGTAHRDVAYRLRGLHRLVRHVAAVDLPRVRALARQAEDQNADLRLAYLLKKIDDQEWRRKLQQREKRRERSFAVMQVYEMFVAAATDAYAGLVEGAQPAVGAMTELLQIQQFANDSLMAIGKRFNMTPGLLYTG